MVGAGMGVSIVPEMAVEKKSGLQVCSDRGSGGFANDRSSGAARAVAYETAESFFGAPENIFADG